MIGCAATTAMMRSMTTGDGCWSAIARSSESMALIIRHSAFGIRHSGFGVRDSLKRLPYRDMDRVGGLELVPDDTPIQFEADVDPDGSDRRLDAQPGAHRSTQIGDVEIAGARIDVAAIHE